MFVLGIHLGSTDAAARKLIPNEYEEPLIRTSIPGPKSKVNRPYYSSARGFWGPLKEKENNSLVLDTAKPSRFKVHLTSTVSKNKRY